MNLLPNDGNTPEKIYRKLLVAGKEVHHLYQFLGHEFPGNHIVSEVHQNSIKKGKDIQLSPNLEKRCTGLMERLDAEWKKQKNEYLASWGEFANQWLV